LVLALLLLPLAATGCFEVGEVAVENRSAEAIWIWPTQVECDHNLRFGRGVKVVPPDGRQTVTVFESSRFELGKCIAVVGQPELTGDVVFTRQYERATLYAITRRGTVLQIEPVGEHEEEFTFDFDTSVHISTTMALICGAPLALGALASLWITVKFFVDFGKRPYAGVS
jgi:hypothetical protein